MTSDPSPQDRPEYALVKFYSQRAAAVAQKTLNGRLFVGGKALKVAIYVYPYICSHIPRSDTMPIYSFTVRYMTIPWLCLLVEI